MHPGRGSGAVERAGAVTDEQLLALIVGGGIVAAAFVGLGIAGLLNRYWRRPKRRRDVR